MSSFFDCGTLELRHEDASWYVTLEYSGPETHWEPASAKTPVKAQPQILWLYEKSLVNDYAASFWMMAGPARVLYSALMEWLTVKIDEHAPGLYWPMRTALWKREERVRAVFARARLF